MEFVRYAVVGVLTAFVYFFGVYGLSHIFEVEIIVSTCVSYFFAVLVNYIINYRWTFSSLSSHKIAAKRYFVMVVFGALINSSFVYVAHYILGLAFIPVQLSAIAVVCASNYFISRGWVYLPS